MSLKSTIVQLILNATASGKALIMAVDAAAQRALLSVYSAAQVDTELSGKQATLVSGTNLKTINSTSLLGSGDITVGLSGTGSTDRAILVANGTGGTSLTASPVTVASDGTTVFNNASTRNLTVSNTGRITGQKSYSGVGIDPYIDINGGTGIVLNCAGLSTSLTVGNGFTFSGANPVQLNAITGSSSGLSIYGDYGAGIAGRSVRLIAYNGSTFVNMVTVDNTTGGTDPTVALLKTTCTSLTASGLVCCGVYTFATVPSASANTGKFLRISDRAQKHAYSDGTDWRFFGDDAIIS